MYYIDDVPKEVCRQCPKANIIQHTWVECYHAKQIENAVCMYSDSEIKKITAEQQLKGIRS